MIVAAAWAFTLLPTGGGHDIDMFSTGHSGHRAGFGADHEDEGYGCGTSYSVGNLL